MSRAITIVVPVYGDWPSLSACITSMQKHVDTATHRVMLVNDCGPEADLLERNIQSAIKNSQGFVYHRNPENLGFIGNCNRAVNELDETNNDILLLNSDTIVTEGFLEELAAVLHESPKHGAVSPRSNNASITTVPLSMAVKKGIEADRSFEIWNQIKHRLPRYYEAPVAHGFCMLIRRSVIKRYGLFDDAFGKGYGEEVDFCQRIAQHGYSSLIANHAYVFHEEAKSFSLETKSKLLERNNKLIWSRYPEYRQSVRDYMEKTVPFELDVERQAGVKSYVGTKTRAKNFLKNKKPIVKIMRHLGRY